MRKKTSYRKKPKERQMGGLSVKVYNNNVELALKKLKKKVKNSNLFLDLKKKSYYRKPSEINREKRNLSKLRQKYQTQQD
jgi:small subunit ribosomal protein S21